MGSKILSCFLTGKQACLVVEGYDLREMKNSKSTRKGIISEAISWSKEEEIGTSARQTAVKIF